MSVIGGWGRDTGGLGDGTQREKSMSSPGSSPKVA